MNNNISFKNRLIAHYHFDNPENIGQDSSGFQLEASVEGTTKPIIETVGGRSAVTLAGGKNGTSYIKLPSRLLKDINDQTGITVSSWVYLKKGSNVWERIFDFGKDAGGPNLFLTRNLRGVAHLQSDLVADAGRTYASGEWLHIAISVSGTEGGTSSSAGPVIYVNGEVVADGSISQTSSGNYKRLRNWFETFAEEDNYNNNFIGRSQHAADPDFAGSLSDFRIYRAGLTQDEIIELMCESLTDAEIVELAKDKYLDFPITVISKDVTLPTSLMGEKVTVSWKSSDTSALSNAGKVEKLTEPKGVTLTAN